MCILKTGTRFFAPNGAPTDAPILPTIPNEWAIELEIKDSRVGRSAVAKALNHGNSRPPFKQARKEAYEAGWVDRPRHFQGLVFSDSPIDGAERFLLAHIRGGAPNPAILTIPDDSGNCSGASWHVFALSLGDSVDGSAADFVTRFVEGQGFLMKSCDGSLILAVYHEETEGSPAYWHVYGGGGNLYTKFLEEAKKDAARNGVLLYEA